MQKFLNNQTEENRTVYVKQRNYCVLLLRKTKKMYYYNLDEKSITHNRRFWKTVEPLLSDKLTVKEKINLSENGEILKTEWRQPRFSTNYLRMLFKILTFLDFQISIL